MSSSSVTRAGLAIALLSAASFGLSGSLAAPLLTAGWSPAAVVLLRIGVAALILAVPATVVLRRSWRPDRRATVYLGVYGLTAVAGAQLCFFSAVQYLPVSVALLLEYSAPVLLIGWHWARSGHRPAVPVLVGAGIAMAGMIGVLDVAGGAPLHPVGIAYGLGAAVCLACYFVLSEQQARPIPALAVAAGGTAVGAIAIAVAGLAGVVPLTFSAATVTVGGTAVSWLVPAALLVLITCVLAYLTGIVAVRRLGAQNASFAALTEVLFAVLAATVLLGQTPTATQAAGGLLVLTGVVVVQRARAVSAPRPGRPAGRARPRSTAGSAARP